jgi:hypothetical protein
MFYRLTSTNPQYGNMELKSLEDWTLEKQFKSVPGVVDVSSFGGMTRSFRSTSIPKSSSPMASASLTQEGDYPYEDHVTFTVTSSLPTELTLHFRIPAWAEGASVSIPLLGATEKNAPSVRTPIRLMSTLNFTLRRSRRSRYSVQPSVILATIAP